MTEPSRSAGHTIVPYSGYRVAAAALRWLAEAFGFEERQAYAAPEGTVMHAEMAFGAGVVMIGTGEPPAEGDAAATSPTEHGVYVVVGDVDAHHERAKSAGARIVYGPEETDFGTRRYRVLDPKATSGASEPTAPRPCRGLSAAPAACRIPRVTLRPGGFPRRTEWTERGWKLEGWPGRSHTPTNASG